MKQFTHSELVKIAYRWVLKNGSCGVAFRELVCTANGEIPDVIGFGSSHSVLIECKATRSDFLADKKKSFRINPSIGMGKIRYFCCPKDLIKVDELPDGWGLIYVNDDGKAIRVHRPTSTHPDYPHMKWDYYHQHNIKAENALMYSALRRLQIRGRVEEIYIDLAESKTDQR